MGGASPCRRHPSPGEPPGVVWDDPSGPGKGAATPGAGRCSSPPRNSRSRARPGVQERGHTRQAGVPDVGRTGGRERREEAGKWTGPAAKGSAGRAEALRPDAGGPGRPRRPVETGMTW